MHGGLGAYRCLRCCNVHQSLVRSVLLYVSETWTLLLLTSDSWRPSTWNVSDTFSGSTGMTTVYLQYRCHLHCWTWSFDGVMRSSVTYNVYSQVIRRRTCSSSTALSDQPNTWSPCYSWVEIPSWSPGRPATSGWIYRYALITTSYFYFQVPE